MPGLRDVSDAVLLCAFAETGCAGFQKNGPGLCLPDTRKGCKGFLVSGQRPSGTVAILGYGSKGTFVSCCGLSANGCLALFARFAGCVPKK